MALRGEDPDRAIAGFLAVLARDPDRVSSLRAAGRLDMKARRHDDALRHWRRLARLAPDDPEPHVQMGRIHRHAGRHDQAVAEAKVALGLSPHHAAAEDLKARAETRALGDRRSPGAVGRRLANLFAKFGWFRPAVGARSQDRGEALLTRAREFADRDDVDGLAAALEDLLATLGPDPRVMALIKTHRASLEPKASPWLRAALDHATQGNSGDIADWLAARRRAGGLGDAQRSTSAATDRLLRRLANDLRGGELGALSRTLEHVGRLAHADDRARGALVRHGDHMLERLDLQRAQLTPAATAVIETRLMEAYADQAWFIQRLARQRELAGSPAAALAAYANLSDDAAGAAPALLHATTLACALGDWDAAVPLARRVVRLAGDDRRLVTAVSDLLVDSGRPDEAAACWRVVTESDGPRLWSRLGLIRALTAAGEWDAIARVALATLKDASPLAGLAAADQNLLIDIVRRLVQALSRLSGVVDIPASAEALARREPPSALREWILASLDLAAMDATTALRRLDEALLAEPLASEVALDLHAEKALIYQHYHRYGEALDEFAAAREGLLAANTHYRRRFDQISDVARLCATAEIPLRYPECLFDVVLEEAARLPAPYTPLERHVAMVSGSLGQGGGERQTITVVRRILEDARVAKLTLLVRSTHLRASDDFFLANVSELPVDLDVYGKAWSSRADLIQLLPEFAGRDRMLAALDLLPHNAREEVARLCRRIFDIRPQAVHIWQDIPHAALACALAGVPHFFVHRGSLAPDFWEQTEHQTAVHFRPMRHAYRRLLERPDFVILNNSISGCRTDQEWLGWPDAEPFQVVYNAVDFDRLGPPVGRNIDLRAQLGIPDDAPVVGGSFRIMAVKRPLYWIEAARRIRQAIPNAHFVIIGDGDMTQEVAAYAREYGFADAVHLPGRVSEVGAWYRTMDLTLMTSEREGIPNAIIEAQHFGVPVVATAVGGIAEAIEEGVTGWVVPGDDGPAPYADRAIAALNDGVWLAAARTRAPTFVHQKFSLDRVLDRLVTYYGIDQGKDTAA